MREKNVKCFMSTNDFMFKEMEDAILSAEKSTASGNFVITVDESKAYQEIDGYGASFTDSSAYLVYTIPDKDERDKVMRKLFSHEEGVGLSVIRQTIGACDFSRFEYNYDSCAKGETDFELKKFSIDHDREQMIPLLKQALEINPDLKIMASPWSAPEWMKTNGDMKAGKLREDCYDAFAQYFVKYIKEYEKEGIEIYAITPQNEPLFEPDHYPSMDFQAEEEAIFIRDHLGPAFEKNGIKTKILAYDHNWDEPEYPIHVIEEAGKYVDGTAWHHYGGDVTAQTLVHEKFPDKETYFTEGSGGEWVPPFEQAFFEIINEGILITRHWSKCFIMWNIALDEKNGPMPCTDTPTCRGVLTVDSNTREVTYNLDYYAIAHFSKFIKSGAKRIESTSDEKDVLSLAVVNPDKSKVVVVYNPNREARKIDVLIGEERFSYDMPEKSAATFVIG